MEHTPISAALYLAERGYTVTSKKTHTIAPPKPDTIRRWCMRGELPARRLGYIWLIEQATLDALIAERAPHA